MAKYDRAYIDSFLIGFGAGMMDLLWFLTTGSPIPVIVGIVLLLLVLFVVPVVLVVLHIDGPLPLLGPHQ
jgi:hypothetical protein